jgi:hypothetical protein
LKEEVRLRAGKKKRLFSLKRAVEATDEQRLSQIRGSDGESRSRPPDEIIFSEKSVLICVLL